MTTKLPDNQLIGSDPASDHDARAPEADAGEAFAAQPGHADAAKLRPQLPALQEGSPVAARAEPVAATAAPQPSRQTETRPASPAALPAIRTAGGERAEIARRIAAFRNLQLKLKQDRESYFDATMAQTRELLSRQAKP